MTYVPPTPASLASGLTLANWAGTTSALPSIALAWNRLSRPPMAKTTLSWVGWAVVPVPAAG